MFRGPKLPTPKGVKSKTVGALLLLPVLNAVGAFLMFMLGRESKLVNLFLWLLLGLVALDRLYRLLLRIWRRF